MLRIQPEDNARRSRDNTGDVGATPKHEEGTNNHEHILKTTKKSFQGLEETPDVQCTPLCNNTSNKST